MKICRINRYDCYTKFAIIMKKKKITLCRPLWTITFCSWRRRGRRRRLGQRHHRELRQASPRSSIRWRREWHGWTVIFWPLASRQSHLCSNQISSPCRARTWDVSMPSHRTYPSISLVLLSRYLFIVFPSCSSLFSQCWKSFFRNLSFEK